MTESSIPLTWDTDWLPPLGRAAEIQKCVRDDLRSSGIDLKRPDKLVFHHVFLGPDSEGPLVFVYSKRGSPAFHCRYDAQPVWERLGERAA